MSVEPPPSDWVDGRTVAAGREHILDGDTGRRTQSIPRVVLEQPAGAEPPRPDAPPPPTWPRDHTAGPPETAYQVPVHQEAAVTGQVGVFGDLARWWRNLSFGLWQQDQLFALFGFLVLVAVMVYGWNQGLFGGGFFTEATEQQPAAPEIVEEASAGDGVDGTGEGLRSTASFDDDRASSSSSESSSDDGSGAKLFVTKKTPGTKSATTAPVLGADDDLEDTELKSETIDGSSGVEDDELDADQRSPSTTVATRFETCAEAVAAGAAPIRLGEPGYRLSLDRDKDGIACENGATPEDPGDAPRDSLNTTTTNTSTTRPSTTSTTRSAPVGTSPTTVASSTTRSSTTESTTTSTSITTTASTTTRPTSTVTSTTTSTTRPASTTSRFTTTTRFTSSTVATTLSTTTTTPTSTPTSASTSTSTSASTSTTTTTSTTERSTTTAPSTTTVPPTTAEPSTTAKPVDPEPEEPDDAAGLNLALSLIRGGPG